ncbi:MAG: hypothetical protein AAF841_07040 [Pseudomonadota bacterium]
MADDIEELVTDKRQGWRGSPAKARRRQRRYKKQLTDEIARLAQGQEESDLT